MDPSLEVVREAALSCGGRVHVTVPGSSCRTAAGASRPPTGVASLTETTLVEAVRTAGLIKTPPTPVSQVTIVVPGMRLAELVRRALDLNLTVTYQRVDLTPLFGAEVGDQAHAPGGGPGRSGYVVDLAAGGGNVSPSLVAALERDPFVLAAAGCGTGF